MYQVYFLYPLHYGPRAVKSAWVRNCRPPSCRNSLFGVLWRKKTKWKVRNQNWRNVISFTRWNYILSFSLARHRNVTSLLFPFLCTSVVTSTPLKSPSLASFVLDPRLRMCIFKIANGGPSKHSMVAFSITGSVFNIRDSFSTTNPRGWIKVAFGWKLNQLKNFLNKIVASVFDIR